MFIPGKPTVIIDGQWGSTGKGKLAGFLCSRHRVDMAVCDYMPNAGHVHVENGVSFTFRQLPVASLFGIRCCIGPHAVIDPDVLISEVAMIAEHTGRVPDITVHPMTTIVTDEDKSEEQKWTASIAGTAKGGHSSYVRKIKRNGTARFVAGCREVRSVATIADTHEICQDAMYLGENVLIETAQGFDLGMNHGYSYPFVTGRDCLVGRALDNAGVPVSMCGNIVASLRTFPIRVGNTLEGHSGPCYPGQTEMSWGEVSNISGKSVMETTTVTKRTRRVFTFSDKQIIRFCRHVRPTHAFLNFMNYYPAKQWPEVLNHIGGLLSGQGCKLTFVGTGPDVNDMVTANMIQNQFELIPSPKGG